MMNVLKTKLPGLIGGSADLNPSTMTELSGTGNFENPAMAVGDLQGSAAGGWGYAGRNIQFGVREHGMGTIVNGLAIHGGLMPFAATFLAFSDYMRPSIRLAALMEVPVVYVFTHDSIGIGEDGPTHQPVEQVASLRAIPRLIVIRPGDANETVVAWRVAIETGDRPVALILTRQKVPTLDRQQFSPAEGLRQGAYILSEAKLGPPRLILIASGSEVGLIVAAGEILHEHGIPVRLVSMPSWELFEDQSQEYRNQVLPPELYARLAVEAGVSQGWHRYTGDRGEVIGVDHFGASAPGPVVMHEYGFSVENVCKRALALLKREHV
jgi:transketolase